MAIENTYLLGKNITLGCGFDLQAKAPLDSRQIVPAFAGLQALIDGNAAYEGMIVYDEETKKTYQAQIIDDVLKFREFGVTEAELKDLIASETTAAMEFKGAATALPENPSKGDMYKVTVEFEVEDETVKVGDSIVYNGEQWFIIPSGDDIEDTWRPVTGVDNGSTLTFEAGDKLEKTVAADGTITYKHVAIDAPVNQNSDEDEPTRTYITQLITDNHGHIIGFKTATENVEDTNTTYEFEGLPVVDGEEAPSSVYFQVKSSDAESAEVIYLDAYNKNEADAELAKKVDKVDGYSLVSDTEIARLADVDNYDDEEVRGLIGDNADAIDELAEYVGTIPNVPGEDGNNKYADLDVIGYINKKAQETLAAASGNSSETAASVKGQLDDYIGENNTRVKAVEDAIDAINDTENGILKQAQDYADGLAGNYDEAGAAAGVQTALEAEIAKKVDKVDGKSLIDDSEIARLATLANYDDTAIKADIAKKADAETMTTELGKKVDKVDGKELIATSEIERLATLKNYDDTALAGRVTDAEGKITALETESAKHALKTDVEAIDAKFADYTKTADLPTDLGDFTNNAGYAKIADVNVELNKKADKTQVATDIANAIAPLATTEALNGVKATAEAATTVEEVDAQIDAKITALNLSTTYEPIGAETRAKAYADGLITDANLDQYTTEQEVKDIVDGVIAGAVDGDTITGLANLVEYLNTHGSEAKEMGAAIDVLEGKVETIEGKPAYGITATQISNWDNEVGAKALAETKTTTAEVKDQIEAYGYATTGELAAEKSAREAKEAELATAIETAKTEASNKDAVVLAEAQKYADQAKADAISAATTDAQTKVNALAETVYTKAEVEALIEQAHTWGSF